MSHYPDTAVVVVVCLFLIQTTLFVRENLIEKTDHDNRNSSNDDNNNNITYYYMLAINGSCTFSSAPCSQQLALSYSSVNPSQLYRMRKNRARVHLRRSREVLYAQLGSLFPKYHTLRLCVCAFVRVRVCVHAYTYMCVRFDQQTVLPNHPSHSALTRQLSDDLDPSFAFFSFTNS